MIWKSKTFPFVVVVLALAGHTPSRAENISRMSAFDPKRTS